MTAPSVLGFYGLNGFSPAARRRSRSALPREMYYNRSRWSLAAEASNNLLNVESPSVPLVRGRSVRRSHFALLKDNAVAENASGSRTKSAEEYFTTKNTNKWKAVMEFAKRTELRSSPKANQNDEKCSYQNDEAENLPWM